MVREPPIDIWWHCSARTVALSRWHDPIARDLLKVEPAIDLGLDAVKFHLPDHTNQPPVIDRARAETPTRRFRTGCSRNRARDDDLCARGPDDGGRLVDGALER